MAEGPFPNWIYNGPLESAEKLQMQEESKNPDNWKGGDGRVKIGFSAGSAALSLTFLVLLCSAAFWI